MTIEHDNEVRNELVSRTYGEFSDERVPERINQDILRIANGEPVEDRSSLSWTSVWTKPVALAATIAVGLAIAMEISRTPNIPADVAAPPAASISETFEPRSADVLDATLQRANDNAGAIVEKNTTEAPSLQRQPAPQAPVENGVSEKPLLMPQADEARNDDADSVETTRRKVTDVPAAASSKTLAIDNSVSVTAEKSMLLPKTETDLERVHHCDLGVRQIADDWMACIESLRLSGATDDADRELVEYRLEFPEKSPDR